MIKANRTKQNKTKHTLSKQGHDKTHGKKYTLSYDVHTNRGRKDATAASLRVPLPALAGRDATGVPLDGHGDLGPVHIAGAKDQVPQDQIRVFRPQLGRRKRLHRLVHFESMFMVVFLAPLLLFLFFLFL